ncbi:hypothetical protein TBLA_0I03450 [Henningerozyma blattae CBS 6284]|uniref:Increased recombination centers protein 6 n=1 Tax=Henningerozyma blattae (strain ATCC 34711 / CBS 6284 / DSM 70876 / NBRC 10599 / NRRL Y-10934 / UCD 77-7) TaxID=1071380 RepID=I2H9E6_HENB6|nr:hypothetical protein TBLA_0I03450 [Tetrapisispora blattae CBS 6284]CCH62998.1 hypothetical protein TBLA_0I03450 [Tetrapisispora blattae CBS 6284]
MQCMPDIENLNIIKDLEWNTKYYRAKFDLYIDEITDFDEWIAEFQNEEYEMLRLILAGVIYIDSDYIQHSQLEKFNRTICQKNSFLVWYIHNKKLGNTLLQKELDGINEELISGTSVCELIRHSEEKDLRNEYGDMVGLGRLHEIIDTYPWRNAYLKNKSSRNSKVGTANDEAELHSKKDTSADEFQNILAQLMQAKNHFSILTDQDENTADLFAQETADKLAALLLDEGEK